MAGRKVPAFDNRRVKIYPVSVAQDFSHIQRACNDLPYFVAHYFSDLVIKLKLDLTKTGLHRQLLVEMEACVKRGYRGWDQPTMPYGPLWQALVSAREMLKSGCVRFLYMWLMSAPEHLREAYVVNLSRDRDKAQINLDYVKEMYNAPERADWRADFGFPDDAREDFRCYNVYEIETDEGQRADGSYRAPFRLEVYGRDKMRGFHPGLMVCDDLEELVDVQNPDTLRDYKERFARELMPSISTMKPMIYIGTLLTETALFTHIARGENCIKGHPSFGWRCREWDLVDENGESVWKEVWPPERIEYTRQTMDTISEGAFGYEFMNDVKAFKNQVWSVQWWPEDSPPPDELKMGYYGPPAGKLIGPARWQANDGTFHFSVVDPATSKAARADYTACISAVVCRDKQSPHHGHAWIIDDWRGKLSTLEVMQKMHEQADRYPGYFGIEASQGGTFFEIMKHERSSKTANQVTVLRLDPWGASPEDRARRGSFLVQLKRIHLAPWISKEFRFEVNRFPFNRPGHDDYASCLSYLQQMISEHILSLPKYVEPKTLSRHAREIAELMHPSPHKNLLIPNVGKTNLF